MSASNTVSQHRPHLLPFLTNWLAVAGLVVIITSSVWWSEAPEIPSSRGEGGLSTSYPMTGDFMRDRRMMRFMGGALVSIPVLCCALYVIVAPSYGEADKKWAYGAVGTLLGFWLGTT